MPYRPILATLAYVRSPDRSQVLLVHRVARDDDEQHGLYNGLGGKLEADEDVVAGVRRELREEAGIEATDVRLRGTISWPGFGSDGSDWFGFIFAVDAFTGDVAEASPEGPLAWVRLDALGELPMWPGDRHFLPLVFDESVAQFHGVMPYWQGRPTRWRVSVIRMDD